ncbi:hypothetical protein E3O44_17800 [Cryobacterium algoricola]|uniref:Peptidase C39-like domain-containing protein n=1 Tax=Cryobacterium algoricola TaxID=1259183 RepID=A0ABY2I7P2_9MICO|nr:peptidase C39 family protein [Cryobacterium algoricola]TFB83717.1 hypothetical protein E3O44_17800 [Cryobacterium algoricola]
MTQSLEWLAPTGTGLPGDVAMILTADQRERWTIDRSFYSPEIVTLREAGQDSVEAAALLSSRPHTAAVKIVDVVAAAGLSEAAAHAAVLRLVTAIQATARSRGLASVRWEAHPGAADPGSFGFQSLPAPRPSGPGTAGPDGFVWWSQDWPHRELDYYRQTTNYTCGAVAALVAQPFDVFSGTEPDIRRAELAFWRQATNFPACEPVGLAVAIHGRLSEREGVGAADGLEVYLDAKGPVLLEWEPEGHGRALRAELQQISRADAEALGLPILPGRLGIDELTDAVGRGRLALLLVDETLMHGDPEPHWVVAHTTRDGIFLIQDPWVDADHGESWVDAHDLPVPAAALDRMMNWGDPGYRGVILYP